MGDKRGREPDGGEPAAKKTPMLPPPLPRRAPPGGKAGDEKPLPPKKPHVKAEPEKHDSYSDARGSFKELLERERAGSLEDSGEKVLLKKMKLQYKWFNPPESLGMPPEGTKLVVKKRDEKLGEISVDGSPYYLFGKDAKVVEVHCEHPSISRVHCALVFSADGVANLEDLSSSYGTLLTDSEATERKLEPRTPTPLSKKAFFTLAGSAREYHLVFPSRRQLQKKEASQVRRAELESRLATAVPVAQPAAQKISLEDAVAAELQVKPKQEKRESKPEPADKEKKKDDSEPGVIETGSEVNSLLRVPEAPQQRNQPAAPQPRAAPSISPVAAPDEPVEADDDDVSEPELGDTRLEVLEEKRLTKKLAHLLLKPDKGWSVGADGWVPFGTLLAVPELSHLLKDHLKTFALFDAKKRFELRKHRGNYFLRSSDRGLYEDTHLAVTPWQPQGDTVVHLTSQEGWKTIQKAKGISIGARKWIRLTTGKWIEDAAKGELAEDEHVAIDLDLGQLLQAGIKLHSAEREVEGDVAQTTRPVLVTEGKKGFIKAKYIKQVRSIENGEILRSD